MDPKRDGANCDDPIHFMRFDERIHIKMGPSKIEKVSCAECRTYKNKVLLEKNHSMVSNALFTTEKMTGLLVCNTLTSLHFTELISNKLKEVPENIRAKYSIDPSMVLGINNHPFSINS